MEISMWHVYLVMQLDSIARLAFAFSILSGVVMVVLVVVSSCVYFEWDKGIKSFIPVGILLPVFSFFMLCSAFIPSSKTAAAMIILPQIANSKTVTEEIPKEISDLYSLAKEALADVVKKEEK